MSLDSSFWIGSPATRAAVEDCVLKTGQYERMVIAGKPKLVADGTIVTVWAPPLSHYLPGAAGMKAAVELSFVNTSDDRLKDWTLNTMRAVAGLLAAFSGDALFRYSSDDPAFLRKGGRLILNRGCGLWQPDVEPQTLPLLPRPYSFGAIELDETE